MSDTFDFDEFWREYQAHHPSDDAPDPAPKTIHVGGEAYPLPATLPALSVLRMMRGGRTPFEILESGRALFGQATLEAWAADGMTMEAIIHAINVAEQLIRGTPGEALMRVAQGDDEDAKKK